MTVEQLMSALANKNPKTEIVLHDYEGDKLFSACLYKKDCVTGVEEKIVLESKNDYDLSSELAGMFEYASIMEMDELDFFIGLLEKGYTLDDIKTYLPEKYEYSKTFMEEHGLI